MAVFYPLDYMTAAHMGSGGKLGIEPPLAREINHRW